VLAGESRGVQAIRREGGLGEVERVFAAKSKEIVGIEQDFDISVEKEYAGG
jgi:hypothetical protein